MKFKNNKELSILTISYGDFSVDYKYEDGLTARDLIEKGMEEFSKKAVEKFLISVDWMDVYIYNTITGKVKKFNRCDVIRWFEDGDDVSNYDVVWHHSRKCAEKQDYCERKHKQMIKEIALKNFLDSEEEFEYDPKSDN